MIILINESSCNLTFIYLSTWLRYDLTNSPCLKKNKQACCYIRVATYTRYQNPLTFPDLFLFFPDQSSIEKLRRAY